MKLNKDQKASRKFMLADALKRGGIVANNGNMTAIFVPTINGNGHFALSYAGKQKFKRKYGEYVALDRLSFGECLPITQDDFYEFCIAFDLNIRENDPPNDFPPAPPTVYNLPIDPPALTPVAAWPFPIDRRI